MSNSKEHIEKAKTDWNEAIENNFINTYFIQQAPEDKDFIQLPDEVSGSPKSTKECPTT